ncbi:EscR/YscR/HrcR family type III secretion system export apparatus protein [bacterium]|nr:EscR/YscR/HrcR family type III secretion system export apparatus protein [bacterium]
MTGFEVLAQTLATAEKSAPLGFVGVMVFLAMLPFCLLAVTSYLKLSIVFGLLRQALGLQQTPSAAVIGLVSLVLTCHIMQPVVVAIEQKLNLTINSAAPPVGSASMTGSLSEKISAFNVLSSALSPLREFLEAHAFPRERAYFARVDKRCGTGQVAQKKSSAECLAENESYFSLIPAFLISELKSAFAMGVMLFIPFLVIDLVVSNLLVALGMTMVSPMTVALPAKILLFVAADGWFRLTQALVLSYAA